MALSGHPPHRSVLAGLPHTALTLDETTKPRVGIGMKDFRCRKPSPASAVRISRYPASPLAASTQRAEPESLDRRAELVQPSRVAGDGMVIAPAADHARSQDLTSARSGCINAGVAFQFSQLVAHFLAREMRRMVKSPLRVLPQMWVKPRKSNVSGGPAPRLVLRSAA